MMKGDKVVVGVFSYLDDAVTAIEKAKGEKFEFRAYAPTLRHEIEEVAFPQKSPIRIITFLGGVTGCTFGFALAILCSLDWPLRVSAKDIVSIPGFFVIGYECTILFAALSTLIALFHFCRLPDILRKVGYDPRFSNDKFGVVLGCERNDLDKAKSLLKSAGADEVEVREAL